MHKKEHNKKEHHGKVHHVAAEHHNSMRSAKMPSHQFEHDQGELGHESEIKYASEFGNPHSLDKMTEGLAGYAKKHKMQYE